MQISYRTKLLTCIGLLVITIMTLSFVLYNHGPRVRFVSFEDKNSQRSYTKNTNMRIVFDRPIKQANYTALIHISPAVQFTTQTNQQSITLTFKENLASSTKYEISIDNNISDKSGKIMKRGYMHSFVTPSPSYAYLVRNYGDETAQGENTLDHIMIGSQTNEPTAVFSKPEIRSFTANESFIAVAEKQTDTDVLYTINRKTGAVRKEKLPYDGRISQLTMSPRGTHVLYSVQLDYSKVEPEYYKEHTGKVQVLNLEDGTLTILANQQGIPVKASSLNIDSSGQIGMIQENFQAFYIVSPFNDFEPVLIGSHTSTAGFSSDANEIVFRDTNDFFRYDIASSNLLPIELPTDDYVQTMRLGDGALFYSSILYRSNEQLSSIYRMNKWGDAPVQVWNNENPSGMTLQTFHQSYDNSLLALQLNPVACSYDNFGSDSSCTTAQIQIYDTGSQKLVDDIPGINFIWLP